MGQSRVCKNVVYVAEDFGSAQFRYRVKNVIEALEKSERWRGRYFLKSEASKIDFDEVNVLVILRQMAKDGVVLNLMKRAQECGVKVLFDLDDLVFDYKDLGLVWRSVGEKSWLYWAGYFWGVRRIAKKVDGFLCTNEFLAGKLKRSFGKPVKVIPNSLNRAQVEVSDKCVADGGKKHDGFIVGYFSGSPTHAKDFAVVESELICFLKEHNDAKLLVVGYMKFSPEMKEMIRVGKVEVHELVDYLELQELMAGVDVNIAPLLVNDFTNCKSELKFFEAAVVETTTIASPTYTFKKAITDGENGYLAQPGEWYDKLEYLYKHPKKNKEIAKRAREYALRHYYGKEFLEEVEKAYDYFAK